MGFPLEAAGIGFNELAAGSQESKHRPLFRRERRGKGLKKMIEMKKQFHRCPEDIAKKEEIFYISLGLVSEAGLERLHRRTAGKGVLHHPIRRRRFIWRQSGQILAITVKNTGCHLATPHPTRARETGMKVRNTITFIISKNYGPSLSLGLPLWLVYLGGLAMMGIVASLAGLSLMYMLSIPRLQQLELETRRLKEEVETLRDQLLSVNQKAFDRKQVVFAKRRRRSPRVVTLPPVRGTGISGDGLYQPPYRVLSYTMRLNGKRMELRLTLESILPPENNAGGFVFAILENQDKNPVQYLSSPPVETNPEGFPLTYKSGAPFYRARRKMSFRRRMRRKSVQEYFTHVTLYLFSVRGGLMLKERYKLNQDMFFDSKPVVVFHKTKNL